MARPFEGKLAIVTGASRGIGAAIAEALASRGAAVALTYTSESSTEKAQSLAERLSKSHHVEAFPIRADIGSATGPASIIDIIINNAGIAQAKPIADVTVEDFQELYAVNVRGPLFLIQAALPYLPKDRSGRIVNISSVSATFGFVGQSIYAGTKAALDGMTRNWSRELAENATVNSLNPGPVATEMYKAVGPDFHAMIRPFIETSPLSATRGDLDGLEAVEESKKTGGRAADVKEIADLVSMLCSKEAGWCTGSVISANGGMTFSQ